MSYPIILLTALALGQAEPPLADRPTNYSHIVGRFKIAAQAEPAAVLVEDPLRLRVVITGDSAAEPPARKSLQIFPEDLGESFFFEPLVDDDVVAAGRWEFVWKLRPKAADVREIPSFALVYWSPTVRRYLTARSDPIQIQVTAEAKRDAAPPAKLSDSFQELATWSTPSATTPWLPYLIGALAVPIAALSWLLAGPRSRRRRPDAYRQQALAAVTAAPDDAAQIALQFLKDRLAMRTAEPTPADVDAVLKRHGVRRDVRVRWVALCRSAHAQRFAPTPPAMDGHAGEAAALIQSLEVAP